jgi:type IV pilus assembly protein PilB
MLAYSEQTSLRLLKVLSAAGKLPENEIAALSSKGVTAVDYLQQQLEAGAVNEETLGLILMKGFSLRKYDLANYPPDPQALALFTQELIQQYKAVPFGLEDGFLKVAVVDPVTMGAVNVFKNHCHKNIEFYLISSSDFNTLWPQQLVSHSSSVASSFGMPEEGGDFFRIKDVSVDTSNARPPPPVQAASKPEPAAVKTEVRTRTRPLRTKWSIHDGDLVVEFCDQILRQAIASGSSDIHIESFRESARVRMRLDGALQVIEMYSDYLFKNYQAVTTRFKILAGCDISEKRLAQDGAITITEDSGKDIDFRFNLVPTKNGERIVMRILSGDPALSLDKIGFDASDYNKVIEAITAPQGMVLVTGPTGSGKTTTLYGALQYINSPDINILTAEDPIEYYLEGAGQVQANEKIGLGFSAILRAFLRQDPEVILVGEIRDQETIDIAVKAALTGHLLLSTLHTNDAVSSITRMLNMGVPNFMISSALSMIIAQRLARKNCMSCLVPDERITHDILMRIGFTEAEAARVRPMHGAGCPVCSGTGMKGRQGIYEVLRKTKYIEEAILRNEQAPQLLEAARKDGFKTMQEIGREFIVKGIMSVEEYQRTLVMD